MGHFGDLGLAQGQDITFWQEQNTVSLRVEPNEEVRPSRETSMNMG